MLHQIDARANGGVLDVQVGDEVRIELGENPTTGNRWHVESTGDQVAPSGSSYRVEGPGVGAGGKRLLTFLVVRPGTTTIRMKRTRGPDLPASDEQDRFEVTLRVGPANGSPTAPR